VHARLAFLRGYRAAYREASRRVGRWHAAPLTWSYLALTLAVSLLWHLPAGHRLVADCCAYRATDLAGWPDAARLLGSAFLVLRPVEAAWAAVASWLLLAPLEAAIGTRRMLLVAAVGTLLPTLSMGLVFLAAHSAASAPLDVGTSAVVVAAGAALAVWSGSLPIAVLYLVGVGVDVLVSPDLATAEHLLALATGAGLALALRRHGGRWGSAGANALVSTNNGWLRTASEKPRELVSLPARPPTWLAGGRRRPPAPPWCQASRSPRAGRRARGGRGSP
jgi:hypothetical protein